MRLAFVMPVLAASACTSPAPPVDPVVGTFARYDDQGHVIDRLVFDESGNFTSTCEFVEASGTYVVDHMDARRMWLHGKTQGAVEEWSSFLLETTFFADDATFSLAPYVPMEGTEHRHSIYNRTIDGYPALSWHVEPDLYMNPPSYLIGYVDPIWGKNTAEGGDFEKAGSDRLVFDETMTFRELDGGTVIARDEPWHQCLAYDPMPTEAGMLYRRVDESVSRL